jgi:hypothetical protein
MEKFSFDVEDKILRIVFPKGTMITPNIIMESYNKEFEFLQGKTLNDLWDLRDCRISPALDNNFMLDMIDKIKKDRTPDMKHFKTAFLVNSDLGLGMARMFQLMSDSLPFGVGVFKEEDKAKTWLANNNYSIPQ